MELEKRKSLLEVAISAALKAGEEILSVYHSDDFHVETKADDSPLTMADKKAHNVIASMLEPLGIPLLSEEGAHLSFEERSKWDSLWIVDPLDGTKEFIKRNDEFTVNIALILENIPVCGVIYIPVYKQLYLGDVTLGAYRIDNITEWAGSLNELLDQAITLPEQQNLKSYTVVGSRSHMNEQTKQFIEEIKLSHDTVEFVSKGSSLKLCMVAQGVADIYPRFAPTMEWDIAAGDAIVRAAGFQVVLAQDNCPLLYNKESLTNPWFVAGRR